MFRLVDERRARFERVFPSRVRDVRDRVRRLGNCANAQNYRYEGREVLAELDGLQAELDFVRAKLLAGGRR